MTIGYARVSTFDQNLDLQRDALLAAGCERIVEDTASGKDADRPGMNSLKDLLRPGDHLVVWRLDRLGRSLRELIRWMNDANQGLNIIVNDLRCSRVPGCFT